MSRLLAFPLFVFMILFGLPTRAVQGELRNTTTSDQLQQRETVLSQSVGLSSWLIEGRSSETTFPSGRNRISQLKILRSFNETTNWAFDFGMAHIDDQEKTTQIPLGRASLRSHPGLSFLRADLERKLPASWLGIRVPSASFITENELRLTGSVLWGQKWRTSIAWTQSQWSDQNRKNSTDTSLMYGISTGWPWVWIGYGVLSQKYSHQMSDYWSPRKFSTHGLRFDSSFPITDIWSGIFALNLNNYNEDGFTGQGSYGVAGIQARWSPQTEAKLTTTQIRSGQSRSRWSSDEVQFSFTHRFE